MKLTKYLEMMTRKEMATAGEAGQTNLVKVPEVLGAQMTSAPKELPYWLIEDGVYGMEWEERQRIKQNPQLLFGILSEKIFSAKKEPVPNAQVRLVVSRDGAAYWARPHQSIHGPIIAYMMLLGDIPMNQAFSNYKWTDDEYGDWKDAYDRFLCLANKDGRWGLAESYEYDNDYGNRNFDKNHNDGLAAHAILKDFEEVTSPYIPILHSLGIDTSELMLRVRF